MEIIIAPNPVLVKSSRPITNINQDIQELAKNLTSSLANRGIGLSAPQIGQNKAIFITKIPQGKTKIFINPAIIDHSEEKQYFYLAENENHPHKNHHPEPFLEGCLSLPHLYGTVKRWANIEAQWLNINGQTTKQTLIGLEAIVFQHELDHLKGLLFPDRIKKEGGQFFQEKKDQLEKISHQEVNF